MSPLIWLLLVGSELMIVRLTHLILLIALQIAFPIAILLLFLAILRRRLSFVWVSSIRIHISFIHIDHYLFLWVCRSFTRWSKPSSVFIARFWFRLLKEPIKFTLPPILGRSDVTLSAAHLQISLPELQANARLALIQLILLPIVHIIRIILQSSHIHQILIPLIVLLTPLLCRTAALPIKLFLKLQSIPLIILLLLFLELLQLRRRHARSRNLCSALGLGATNWNFQRSFFVLRQVFHVLLPFFVVRIYLRPGHCRWLHLIQKRLIHSLQLQIERRKHRKQFRDAS